MHVYVLILALVNGAAPMVQVFDSAEACVNAAFSFEKAWVARDHVRWSCTPKDGDGEEWRSQ